MNNAFDSLCLALMAGLLALSSQAAEPASTPPKAAVPAVVTKASVPVLDSSNGMPTLDPKYPRSAIGVAQATGIEVHPRPLSLVGAGKALEDRENNAVPVGARGDDTAHDSQLKTNQKPKPSKAGN